MTEQKDFGALLNQLATTLTDIATYIRITPSSPLALAGLAPDAQTERRLSTPWPRIGGHDLIANTSAAVHDPVFQRNYRKGQTVAIYAAGCSALSRLAACAQLPLFKLGTTLQRDLLIRQSELRADRYGCATKNPAGYIESAGWDDWEMRQLQASPAVAEQSPVIFTPRALMITLPATLPFKAFEKELQNILQDVSLSHWANSPIGREHFAQLGMDPSVAQRFTSYRFGSGVRHARAKEIYICRPRDDIARIAAIVERLIVDHVVGHAAPLGSTH